MSEVIQILIGILVSPMTLYSLWAVRRKEKYVCKQMKKKKRYLSWSEVENKLKKGEGTLIIECGYENSRFWWTSDSILSETPPNAESYWTSIWCNKKDPFFDWCYSTYLDFSFGSAFLFECSSDSDFDSLELISKNVSVVRVPFVTNRRTNVAADS